jgi:hypothetical protein
MGLDCMVGLIPQSPKHGSLGEDTDSVRPFLFHKVASATSWSMTPNLLVWIWWHFSSC